MVLLTIVKVPFAVKCCTATLALAVAWAVVVACAAALAAFLTEEYSSHPNTPPPIRSRTSRTAPTMRPMRFPGR
jgi:hypothetical protein